VTLSLTLFEAIDVASVFNQQIVFNVGTDGLFAPDL
jgi:hypothetical protein